MNPLVQPQARPLTALSIDEGREALFRLFASYDPPFGDKANALMDAKVRAYRLGLGKIPGWALDEAVAAFTEGTVERPSRRIGVLPTVEELATEARKGVEREAVKQESRDRFKGTAIHRVPFLDRMDRLRRDNQHRPVLFTGVNHLDTALALSRSGKLPVGAEWIPALGTIYAPGPKREGFE